MTKPFAARYLLALLTVAFLAGCGGDEGEGEQAGPPPGAPGTPGAVTPGAPGTPPGPTTPPDAPTTDTEGSGRLIGAWAGVPPEGEEGELLIEFGEDGSAAFLMRPPDGQASGQEGTWELVSDDGDELVITVSWEGDDRFHIVFESDDRMVAGEEGDVLSPVTFERSDEAAEAIAQAREEGVFESGGTPPGPGETPTPPPDGAGAATEGGERLVGAWSGETPEGEEAGMIVEFGEDGTLAMLGRGPEGEPAGQLGTWEFVSEEGDELVVTISFGGLGEQTLNIVFEADDRMTAGPEGEHPITFLRSDEAAQAVAQARDEGVFERPGPADAARRLACANNLQQIMLAMHNYHDVYGHFPADSYDDQGNPLLSWRVHILPFVEGAELYEQFHLDEPWDSEHNSALVAQMPAVYQCPAAEAGEGVTAYLGIAGDQTLFRPGGEPLGLFDITDGASRTIAVVEATDERAVPWTQPSDLTLDDVTTEALVGHHEGGFQAALADGSVRFLPPDADAEDLRALLTRNGGENVSPDDL